MVAHLNHGGSDANLLLPVLEDEVGQLGRLAALPVLQARLPYLFNTLFRIALAKVLVPDLSTRV